MQSFTLVDLAFSWKEAARYFSQRWLAMLNPYILALFELKRWHSAWPEI